MAVIATIALVIILVAFRLLLPPVPGFMSYFRRWGKRTTILCCSIALFAAAVAILVTKQ
jgi:hypothetical protein